MFAKKSRSCRWRSSCFSKWRPFLPCFPIFLSHCSSLWWFKMQFCIIIWAKILLMTCMFIYVCSLLLVLMILTLCLHQNGRRFVKFPLTSFNLKKTEVSLIAAVAALKLHAHHSHIFNSTLTSSTNVTGLKIIRDHLGSHGTMRVETPAYCIGLYHV